MSRKSKELNKQQDQLLQLIWRNFLKSMESYNAEQICYYLNSYINAGGDKEKAITLIKKEHKVMKQVLKNSAALLRLDRFDFLVKVLQNKFYIFWPEMEMSFYKDILIKNLLIDLKKGDWLHVRHAYLTLKKYDWPELKIIEKSLRAEGKL